MMEELLNFFSVYGLEAGLLALGVIFVIGCLKVLFVKRLEISSGSKKPIYEVLSLGLSFGLSAAWLAVRGIWFGIEGEPLTWDSLVKQATLVIAAVHIIYPLYENLGLRGLLELVGKALLNIFKKNEKVAELAKVIEVATTKTEKDKDKTEIQL